METAIVTALAKELGKVAKKSRKDLTVGEHKVAGSVTLDFEGTVTVGADESYIPTTSVPFKTALALFVRYSGVTGEHAAAALRQAMTDAVEFERLDKVERATKVDAIRAIADLGEAEANVTKLVASLPSAERAGKVKVKVTVAEAGGAEVV